MPPPAGPRTVLWIAMMARSPVARSEMKVTFSWSSKAAVLEYGHELFLVQRIMHRARWPGRRVPQHCLALSAASRSSRPTSTPVTRDRCRAVERASLIGAISSLAFSAAASISLSSSSIPRSICSAALARIGRSATAPRAIRIVVAAPTRWMLTDHRAVHLGQIRAVSGELGEGGARRSVGQAETDLGQDLAVQHVLTGPGEEVRERDRPFPVRGRPA